MIVHLNGWPGVGKLTVARALVARLGGHLLDNHTIYNVAFSLTEFGSPEFFATVRAVRDIAYDRVLELPAGVPVTVTNALWESSAWGQENWDLLLDLAKRRGCAFHAVTLTCSDAVRFARTANPERALLRKVTDPTKLRPNLPKPLEAGADRVLRLDTTDRPPEDCADQIFRWLAT